MADKIFNKFLFTIGCIVVTVIIGSVIFLCILEATKKEINTYQTVCEIMHLDYAEEQVSKYDSDAAYKMSIKNDDFSGVLEISAEQYAQYSEGEEIKIQVITFEYITGVTIDEYKIIE